MIRVNFPLDAMTRFVRTAQRKIREDERNLLDQLGTQVLSFVQQAYREKARGGTGGDGITWKPLSRKTLEVRVRRRAAARRIVNRRRELSIQIKELEIEAKRQLHAARMSRKPGEFRRTTNRLRKTRLKIESLRQKRREQSEKLQALIDREVGRHEIGVDTGLQRSAAAPGFTDPGRVWTKTPDDGEGENLFEIRQSTVAVGYNRSYSEHFDAARPLFPETVPDEWQRSLDQITQRWANKVRDDSIREMG